MKAIILSAGFGTRLREITGESPKVMVPVGGKPLLEHLIILCKLHGISDIIINLHYKPQIITNYFGDGRKWGVNIEYSHEVNQIMGGAGALKHAEELLGGEQFIVLNGDVMTNINLSEMVNFHKNNAGLATFFVHDSDHPEDSDLVEFDDTNTITKFYRGSTTGKSPAISKSGTHIFEPEVLNFIPSGIPYSLEKELIPELVSKKVKLCAYYSNAYSKDAGTPDRYNKVITDYNNGKIIF
jgi:mannose-1-phosphate guanylyltransferase